MDTDFHRIIKNGIVINHPQPIVIGNHVWVGMNVTLLKGTNIPDNSIIAAGSTVTKSLATSNAVYVNNNLIKDSVNWEK